ncbi:MAG: YciI family protein [Neisseriaceae bacterium]
MFIIDVHYKVSLDIIDQHVTAHRTWLDEKFKDGILLCSGPKEPRTGGVIIALCNSQDQVENLIKQDPYYKNGVAKYTVTKFLSNKCHPQIKDLMS